MGVVLAAVVLVAFTAGLLRFIQLATTYGRPAAKGRTSPCKTLIVMGSGGHTTEMLRLLGGINLEHYKPRVYVMGDTDKMTFEKVEGFESSNGCTAVIERIPRAREVRQSYITSVYSTLIAILYSWPFVYKTWPDLLLCNGPGTCIPVCVCAYLLKFIGAKDIRICYVESICRVEHLSLSGRLLYYVADHLITQWPDLRRRWPRTQYIGKLC